MSSETLQALEESVRVAQRFMQTPDSVQQRADDPARFRETMLRRFPVLADNYPSLFEKLVKGDDVDMVFTFIERLRSINEGKASLDGVRAELAQQLHEQYVVPALNDHK